MKKVVSIALVTCAMFLAVSQSSAQSGRARQTAPPAQPKPSASPTTEEDNSGVNVVDGPPETIEGDVLRVNTSLVTVPVSVMDRYGKYIPDLKRQDFRIFDQGVEQKIAYFATIDQPFTVALVMDTSNSTHFKLEDIQNAAIVFVNQLQPHDRVLVISFDDSIKVLTEATSDRDVLARAIRKTKTGGGTRLYDAVHTVLRKKLSSIEGRKAIVLFTDGVDTTSRSASFSSTLREAQESDGAIYSVSYDTSADVGPMIGQIPTPGTHPNISIGIPGWPGANGGRGGYPGSGANLPEYRLASEYLHELSYTTGGRYLRGDSLSDVSSAFTEIADELRRQYSIGYYPRPVGQPGQVRKIKVTVNKPDIAVKARDSYIYAANKTDDKQAPTTTTTSTPAPPKLEKKP
jgi:VWFA-related protein